VSADVDVDESLSSSFFWGGSVIMSGVIVFMVMLFPFSEDEGPCIPDSDVVIHTCVVGKIDIETWDDMLIDSEFVLKGKFKS
jgi:hypothetical protein